MRLGVVKPAFVFHLFMYMASGLVGVRIIGNLILVGVQESSRTNGKMRQL